MYNTRPGLLIGFHGCDVSRQQQLLHNSKVIPKSEKPFDWLGHGMYFWENNHDRALQWARDNRERGGTIKEPAVVGAAIDLGYCCDLLDDSFTKMVSVYYRLMATEYESIRKALPVNKDSASDHYKDRLIRFLDCATIEFMHEYARKQAAIEMKSRSAKTIKLFDSIRGAFLEGGEAYPGAGISAKAHIQICVRNPNCIKGFFLKRDETDFLQNELTRN